MTSNANLSTFIADARFRLDEVIRVKNAYIKLVTGHLEDIVHETDKCDICGIKASKYGIEHSLDEITFQSLDGRTKTYFVWSCGACGLGVNLGRAGSKKMVIDFIVSNLKDAEESIGKVISQKPDNQEAMELRNELNAIIDEFNNKLGIQISLINRKCFIATAVYGIDYTPDIIKLCDFRDSVLKKYLSGRWLIKIYEALSPKFACMISKSKYLRLLA